MRRAFLLLLTLAVSGWSLSAQAPLDKEQSAWVETTLKKLTLEELVGQMVFASISSTFLSTDTQAYDDLVTLVHEAKVGGILTFGGAEPVPNVMLNPTYGAVILGQPLELASTFNRLQQISSLPLLTTADFEWGAGMRLNGATKFPRAMAYGAAG